jgi:membrane protease YdiL (CAAX protease family)
MTTSQKQLIFFSILIVGLTFGFFYFLPNILGPKWGYVTGFALYWICAILVSLHLGGFESHNWNTLFSMKKGRAALVVSAAAFIPVFGVFFVSFLPNFSKLTVSAGLLLVLMAVINGFVEEFFWRGMYLLEFRKSVVIGMVAAPLLFAAYHIALWFIKGITYQGGFFALVGGAYIMGLLWSWVARKTGTILPVTIAHILVNIFAFTGLFVENGF